MISPLDRARLDVLERERVELNYFDPLDADFALNTYTRLLRADGEEDLPLVTLYAAPDQRVGVTVDRIISWFGEPRRRGYQPVIEMKVIPPRLRPVPGGVMATEAQDPEGGRRLVMLRTTGTFEYVGRWARSEPDPRTGSHMLEVLSIITRSVQLAAAVTDFNGLVGGPARWRVYLNVRGADRAYLTPHEVAGIPVPAADRCFERHLQLVAAFDASGAEDAPWWQVGQNLDLELARAYGFTDRLVHDASGQLLRGLIS